MSLYKWYFRTMTYINRAASRCWTSLLRWRTLKMYCRSVSVMPSKADCDCWLMRSVVLILLASVVVESFEKPVEASINRWILDARGGVGGKRALRPLPIFLSQKKAHAEKEHEIQLMNTAKLVKNLDGVIGVYGHCKI